MSITKREDKRYLVWNILNAWKLFLKKICLVNITQLFLSTATWELTRKTFLSPDTLHINTQKVHVGQNLKNYIKIATSRDVLWRGFIFNLIQRGELIWLYTIHTVKAKTWERHPDVLCPIVWPKFSLLAIYGVKKSFSMVSFFHCILAIHDRLT